MATRKIYLNGKYGRGKFALVDERDYDYLSQFSWHIKSGYASRGEYIGIVNGKKKVRQILMHREIMEFPAYPEFEIDHINGDKLDNRKDNLRVCSHSENISNAKLMSSNKSGIRGVHWNKTCSKWAAQVRKDGRVVYRELFGDKDEAARAYAKAFKAAFGGIA